MFVTNVTTPFMVLESFPALDAMNVAVFSYFYSGFKYGVGPAYEGGPLFVFVATEVTMLKALDDEKEDGPIRTGNNLARAMMVFTVPWIIHSVSYRLYAYRVDWRLEMKWPLHDADNDQQDLRFHIGAAQGHPIWRTPLGQSSSVVMTALAWSMVRVVKQDLALQQCRPDWVFHTMMLGAPILISFIILWNIFSGTRSRTITGLTGQDDERNASLLQRMIRLLGWAMEQSDQGEKDSVYREYVQAAALQGMERNSLSVEEVLSSRLTSADYCIGFVSWFLAHIGLLISGPEFFSSMVLTESFSILFEAHHIFRRLVETNVTDEDRAKTAAVIEQYYVGRPLEDSPGGWPHIADHVLTKGPAQASTNLHTLLDNTGPAELYNMLFRLGHRKPGA